MPHSVSIKTLEKFLEIAPWRKIVKKAENAEKGTRIWPTDRNKDDKLNFRVDKGALVGEKYQLILRANKNAEDKSVRKAAQEDSHQILATGFVDPKNDAERKSAIKGIRMDFLRNRK